MINICMYDSFKWSTRVSLPRDYNKIWMSMIKSTSEKTQICWNLEFLSPCRHNSCFLYKRKCIHCTKCPCFLSTRHGFGAEYGCYSNTSSQSSTADISQGAEVIYPYLQCVQKNNKLQWYKSVLYSMQRYHQVKKLLQLFWQTLQIW